MSKQQTTQQSALQSFFLDTWYNKRWWGWLLLPISWLYQLLSAVYRYQQKKRMTSIAVPVVVVGNISVGGTGKTPVIIALVKALQERGIAVGVISRGYGSQAPYYPYNVSTTDTASVAGDEPLLIAKAANCPVVIAKNRVAGANYLLQQHPTLALILSDDGLQHHPLGRDMEIVVVDGERGLGNHFCLPAGPLREPASRLGSVDWVLLNQPSPTHFVPETNTLLNITLEAKAWRQVRTQALYPITPYPWLHNATEKPTANIKAVAGIGHPQRFFNTLGGLGVSCDTYAFDDHHQFNQEDFSPWLNSVVLMTEKDAVKCQAIDHQQLWSLVVEMSVPEKLLTSIIQLVQSTPSRSHIENK